ncbi:hypothetical protein FRC18_008445 [Serendipita sp. 400]|nr:hypothetical protein FRC18_008445 [Serendipita sp. 400]
MLEGQAGIAEEAPERRFAHETWDSDGEEEKDEVRRARERERERGSSGSLTSTNVGTRILPNAIARVVFYGKGQDIGWIRAGDITSKYAKQDDQNANFSTNESGECKGSTTHTKEYNRIKKRNEGH